MKINISFLSSAALFLGAALLNRTAQAQLTLIGANYAQNFDAISNGLPAGWSIRTDATATNLGTITTNYNASGKTWGDRSGEFGNCAAITSNSGTNFNGDESTIVQGNCTNRALAVRQTGLFGDPGAAFVLQIANTAGLSNLTFNVDLDMLKVNPYATTWTIEYAVGDSPSSFTTLGNYADPETFGATTVTYNLGTDANDSSENVWIRIAALSAAVGSGSRDTFGIDNFSLTWEGNNTSIAVPSITSIMLADGNVQIAFTGDVSDSPSSFTLQSADQTSDDFADTDATIIQNSPGNFQAVCELNGSQQFYRIKRP
ncbi:MAG TPA: hypothetical protein VMA13_08125 [Candidatus Saccharimonadales bacterium]|nr:hypothetical protein [Candidatus Saccharimonadales bacterium]